MILKVVKGQLVEPAVYFSVLKAREALIHSFIRQKPNNIMLREEIFSNIYESKNSIYDIYVRP